MIGVVDVWLEPSAEYITSTVLPFDGAAPFFDGAVGSG